MKPTMLVEEGQQVKLGQALFSDKKFPSLMYTSPGAGRVKAIKRGAKRVLQAVIIELEGDDEVTFDQYSSSEISNLERNTIIANMLQSGMWTALKTRPYSKTPDPESTPNSIFVTATDTNPLAADPNLVLAQYSEAFEDGLTLLSKLTDGKVHVCQNDAGQLTDQPNKNVETHSFSGPHPAGLPSTHIHFVDPVSANKTVWQINYQDVIALGKLFTTGRLWVERIISLAGPVVKKPRIIKTRLGANTEQIVSGELENVQSRVISGSVLSGHTAANWAAHLGRFHNQISVIAEPTERELFGWIKPGSTKFSVLNVFVSKLLGKKSFDLNTSQNGSPRAMVPVGAFEMVSPLDILPTQLLRAIVVKDTDSAQSLGCLELEEDDLALFSFVCSGKFDYGPMLRENLTQIEIEG
jgi:Na+-transporting NADH:ubiquinone oxidoreductase subunit A